LTKQQNQNLAATEGTASGRVGADGLSTAEAERRLAQYGENALREKHVSALARLARFFWGPIPWMIEIAAALSAAVQHWGDFSIIAAMLLLNAGVGFWQEFKADTAIAALKQRLALMARVLRDGRWQEIPARLLVPGDAVLIRLGNIVPADVLLLDGGYLSVDQSALTGESLPVDRKAGDTAYSGSVAKLGEMKAVVTATGMTTYLGKTAQLVETAGTVSHFQRAVLRIGNFLIFSTLALVALILVVALRRGDPLVETILFALILTVAAIPVALPAVLSVTMAVGAERLAHLKAIVSRLVAIEELAGIDVLCADKTGTLTQNKLTLGEPVVLGAADTDDLLIAAALASRREGADAIDQAIFEAVGPAIQHEVYSVTQFQPFDPVNKRTEATVEHAGARFCVTKGAPQVILAMSEPEPAVAAQAGAAIDTLAAKGFRTLGVARRQGPGASSACCRCSIRRARMPPPRSSAPAAWASTSRWSPATMPPSPARSPAASDSARISCRPSGLSPNPARRSTRRQSRRRTASLRSFPSTNMRSSRRCRRRTISSA
jgi:H+-transporting ATPase